MGGEALQTIPYEFNITATRRGGSGVCICRRTDSRAFTRLASAWPGSARLGRAGLVRLPSFGHRSLCGRCMKNGTTKLSDPAFMASAIKNGTSPSLYGKRHKGWHQIIGPHILTYPGSRRPDPELRDHVLSTEHEKAPPFEH